METNTGKNKKSFLKRSTFNRSQDSGSNSSSSSTGFLKETATGETKGHTVDLTWDEKLQTSINKEEEVAEDSRISRLRQQRSSSFTSGVTGKRKTTDTSFEDGRPVVKKRENTAAFTLVETLQMVKKHVADLSRKIEENPNTKREIKEINTKLTRQIRVLESNLINEWLETHRWETPEIPTYDAETQSEWPNGAAENQPNEGAGKDKRPGKDFGCQVNPQEVEKEIKMAIHKDEGEVKTCLTGGGGWEKHKKIIDSVWPEEIFESTYVKFHTKHINGTKGDMAVIVDPKKPEGEIMESIQERYPDVTSLLKEEELTGIEYIRKNTETIISKGGRGEDSQTLFLAPLLTGDTGGKEETEKLYRILSNLKGEMESQGSDRIKIVMADNMDDKYLRKCVEMVFHGSGKGVTVVENGSRKGGKKPSRETKGDRPRWKTESNEKIVVKVEGKKYAEVLRDIKKDIDVNKLGLQINNIRKTARGDVLLEVKGGKEKAQALRGAIVKQNDQIKAEIKNSNVVVHVSNIDADVTNEDIAKAFGREIKTGNEEDIKVISVKENRNGNQNAIVSLNRMDAKTIAKVGVIRIGWTLCKVRERINIVRCYKCLDFGHKTTECKGEDRPKTCLNCGQDDHMAKACENESFCTVCNAKGHRADQRRCPSYRKMVHEKIDNRAAGIREKGAGRRRDVNNPN